MPIKAKEIVVIPQKTFPHLWLAEMVMQGLPNGKMRAQMALVPFDGATGDFEPRPEFMKSLVVEDLFAAAKERPAVAAALNAVLAAVAELYEAASD